MGQHDETMTITLTDLLAQQQAHFVSLRRQLASLQGFTDDPPLGAVLLSRSKIFNATWTQCQETHLRLVCLSTAADQKLEYFKDSVYDTQEDLFLSGLDLLAALQAKTEVATPGAATGPETPIAGDAPDRQRGQLRLDHLPKISLPTFAGSYTDWAKYSAYFESLIKKNSSLDPLQKLHYLLSSLSGEPRELLKHTTFAPESFDTAWTLLKSRYDNSRLIVAAYIKSLFAIPRVKPDSLESLRTLQNRVTEAVAGLENEGRFINVTTPAADTTPGAHEVSDMVVCLVIDRLDDATRKAWELHLGDANDFPHFSQLDKFLAARIRALEACAKPNAVNGALSKRTDTGSKATIHTVTITSPCPICTHCQSHSIYKCNVFRSLSPHARGERARELKLCSNCLGTKHRVNQCTSTYACAQCHGKHHTLLHRPSGGLAPASTKVSPAPVPAKQPTLDPLTEPDTVTLHSSAAIQNPNHVPLATAHVLVGSPSQRKVRVRALLDQGSTRSFVTHDLVRLLKLRTIKATSSLVGIGGAPAGTADSVAGISLEPKDGSGPTFHIQALVLKSLTSYVPHVNRGGGLWPHLEALNLVDDHPERNEPVHVIIGADVYGSLLLDGLVRGRPCEPVAQKTVLGWVLSGPSTPLAVQSDAPTPVYHCNVDDSLHDALTRFWELETCPSVKMFSPEEARCESHFQATHSRTPSGQYMVRLPFKDGPPISIGHSRHIALRSMTALARSLARKPDVSKQYSDFMNEYHALGHMRRVESPGPDAPQAVYLPHHPVMKPGSLTTNLRVVFNASSLTTNFTSLNSHLMIGPKLQPELFNILSQWHAYEFVYCADIARMYRQVLVHPDDHTYQRILWKAHPNSPVEEYKLVTLTYGTACAPYLALRVIQQLAIDDGDLFPLGKQILQRFMYVDDCLFGANDPQSLTQMRRELCDLLARAHFYPRKWGSNDSSLLKNIDSSDHGLAWCPSDSDVPGVKVLGLLWNPQSDTFTFKVNLPPLSTITKRTVLSMIAHLFDPLGWVSPVVIRDKIFLQELWRAELTWDDPLVDELYTRWINLRDDLPSLSGVRIPRWTYQRPHILEGALHGFADASSLAYATVVYVQSTHLLLDGSLTTSLVASKTRVAPIKTKSIPHLELCGTLLLAELMNVLHAIPEYANARRYCWTDATIVLSWLSREPSKREVFVANRVAKIQTLLPEVEWRHVPNADNPADLASRGLAATDLITSSLWWNGPEWLSRDPSSWPSLSVVSNSPERNKLPPLEPCHHIHVTSILDDLYPRTSSWLKLIRVLAYLRRWPRNQRLTTGLCPSRGPIDAQEFQGSETFVFRELQRIQFAVEIEQLQSHIPLTKAHPLLSLDPFLDEDGLLRVGGRLTRFNLEYARKHPIILRDHPVARLLVRYTHPSACTAGFS